MRRYEEQIRVLHEDLESEQHLRRRIEREKQELQMQIISLSERLTEAESGSESQLDINRKREVSVARKIFASVYLVFSCTVIKNKLFTLSLTDCPASN